MSKLLDELAEARRLEKERIRSMAGETIAEAIYIDVGAEEIEIVIKLVSGREIHITASEWLTIRNKEAGGG